MYILLATVFLLFFAGMPIAVYGSVKDKNPLLSVGLVMFASSILLALTGVFLNLSSIP